MSIIRTVCKLQYKLKYSEKTEIVGFNINKTTDVHVIMFSDSTDKEAKDQLLEEIELFKSIGCHRNIVSMLGCWVSSEPIFLLLEYLPYGDLLNWLRKKRQQVQLISENTKVKGFALWDPRECLM